jgi:hypothetical protein
MCILCLVFVPFVPSSRPRKGERSHLWWMSPTSCKVNGNHPGTSITIHNTHTHPFLVPKKNPGTFHSRTPSGFKAVLPTLALLQILKVCCEPSLRSPRPIQRIRGILSQETQSRRAPSCAEPRSSCCPNATVSLSELLDSGTIKRMTVWQPRETGSSRILTNTNYLSKCRAVHISLQSYQS